MKVSHDFTNSVLVESTDGIQLPNKNSFTILAIKVVEGTENWHNNSWLLTDKEEREQKENMFDYYYSRKSVVNPFNEEKEGDLYEQLEMEQIEEAEVHPTFGVKGLKMEKNVFNFGDYKVSQVMYQHDEFDSHYFYNFNKN
jgi:hypothetical protein